MAYTTIELYMYSCNVQCISCESLKHGTRYSFITLPIAGRFTKFSHCWTFNSKRATKPLPHFPSQLRHVATLPCETLFASVSVVADDDMACPGWGERT